MATLSVKDFKSDQTARWCPGCGDHAVLAALTRALPKVSQALDYQKERYVVVSGIGCSSRLPYYMDTYGFHGIHGRATAISTGIKVANPWLTVWQVCGDGDALAIGGNHFIHAIRRNIDINILLFNNRIYGLTKGQYSPTSKFGAITKTSPYGTVEHPFNPGSLVLGAKGTFFARGLDVELALNEEIMTAAALHDGCSVMEILTNCVIFNDGAHMDISDTAVRADSTITLRAGQKMVFGANGEKGLVYDGKKIRAVHIGEGGYTMDDILVHDPHADNIGLHMALADMKGPDYPVALGVIRDVRDVTYDDGVRDQVKDVMKKSQIHCVDDLLRSGSTWEVK
ncbi:MAG: 2-oxoacid:ferredoxin oxidoreductase subunit beta [Bacteroidales bacterium]|nr:2-oxoacid:ferredoxin oxidoreductase subunit beta [Candidatus Cryptobacteroides aphodequi]